MPFPSLHDDGETVTLDLHGATVDEAVRLTTRLVREAVRRGRATAKIVHGHSTSSARYANRTIKNALYDLLDQGVLGDAVTHAWRADGHLLLSLDVTAAANRAPIRLRDIR